MPIELPIPLLLVVVASLLAAGSGLPLLLRLVPLEAGQKLATLLMLLAAACGLAGGGLVLTGGRPETGELAWNLPYDAAVFALDPLSAFFLLPVLIISACCSLYALGYWPAAACRGNVRRLTAALGILAGAMIWVVLARNGVLFLIAWEVMALSAYFALTADDGNEEVRQAGTLYLVTAHLGALALFALFALLRGLSGTFVLPAPASLAAVGPLAGGVFLASMLGFGLKAGFMPLHVWLPAAHANAPSHVSALMSGVILKLGIYGILRTLSCFHGIPLWWGVTLLVTGLVSGVLGVAYALGQHDLKRLLAYHSIENLGIIAMGLGLGLVGLSTGQSALAQLGLAGALLHVLNHATFKALLFLGAGSVIHAAGTREIDRLGGLAKRLPWTAACFLVGAVAICGLPPLNGFVSEFLLYLGFFTGIQAPAGAPVALSALAAPSLALIGGLAVACFVKVYGVVFLGEPRTVEAGAGHEAGWPMLVPMFLLAGLCFLIGAVPLVIRDLLAAAVLSSRPELAGVTPDLAGLAPFGWLTVMAVGLLLVVLVAWRLMQRRLRRLPSATSPTWGCGYLRPTPRMQYTASSFASQLVSFFGGILRPHVKEPAVTGIFPAPTRFHSHVPETVLEHLYLPVLQWLNSRLSVVRRLQHGQLHLYILYIFLTLLGLFIFGRP